MNATTVEAYNVDVVAAAKRCESLMRGEHLLVRALQLQLRHVSRSSPYSWMDCM